MPVIKRYPNRKLYNTHAKRYITLDGIADLIRAGEDVQVIGHADGDDLTTLTLTQIIFEQEKKRGGFLPRSVLTGLIQSSGERIESLRKTLTAPLELLEPVEQEIDRRIQALIKQGELAREEGIKLRDKLLTNFHIFDLRGRGKQEEAIVEVDNSAEFTPADIQNLTSQLDMLTAKVNALLAEKEMSQ
ncbi:MAG TPA: pesticidal protein Cry15Aa [Anaerolineae bacterium]|nr:pesticidal protein Cry15Aa [Anaerolineae bacterium]